MLSRITIFALCLAFLPLFAGARAAPPEPDLVAATWLLTEDGARVQVLALHLRDGKEPFPVHAGFGRTDAETEPGDYGEIPPDGWHAFTVRPGEVLLAKRKLGEGDNAAVLVADAPPEGPLDLHEMIHEEYPEGTRFFGFARSGEGPATVDRHLVAIGGEVELRVEAPGDDGFFREETFEILRVARRLAVDSDDPEGERGFIDVDWKRDEAEDPAAVELAGAAGEERIRSHFTKPDCNWANRHVGWLPDLWILEYRRPAELRFTLKTKGTKTAGIVSDLWNGYGAVCVTSIWPNGFGGSSSNYDLPPVMLVPEGTAVRETVIR